MVRAPCCEKMGMKKGPWTAQEDQILISYIHKYGHANWRALPKHAGLLRCGKSCRLRWINYLRPDIKRGNFSAEEEKTIIKLHEILGNRWSAIAARLPGRTDNEIKNVWHTHLKKRLKQNQTTSDSSVTGKSAESESEPMNPNSSKSPGNTNAPMSPQPSSSCDLSSVTTRETDINMNANENFPEIDETFWLDAPPADHDQNCSKSSDFSAFSDELELQIPFASMEFLEEGTYGYGSNIDDDDMEFWYDLFITAGDLP